MSFQRVVGAKNAKGRHAKTRQVVILAGFRMATFRATRQIKKTVAENATHGMSCNFV